MRLSSKTRYIFFITAIVLIIAALIWTHALKDSPGARICNELRRFGYSLDISDLEYVASWKDTSIRELLSEENTDQIVDISRQSGFNADVDKRGDISLITVSTGDAEIVIFLIGEEIELAFLDDGNELLGLK